MIAVGTKAPAFTLNDQDDRPVRLRDHKGQWVVIYFYPKDDTPGCTTEACEFTASITEFTELAAVVLGCSPDSTERHRRFIEKHDLKIPLLSDPTHGVMEKYDAWGEKVLYGRKSVGVKRSTVIVDPDGTVAHHWRSVRAAGHAAKVRDVLAKLVAARSS